MAYIEKKWTHEWKHLLLKTRLENEQDFSAKKKNGSVSWEKVLQEIKTVDKDFPFSRDEIMRKFLNFMVTYKRIRNRNCASGDSSTSWEFFDAMDEVYGTRSDVVSDNSIKCILDNDSTAFLDGRETPEEPSQKRIRCGMNDFMQNEESVDDKEQIKLFIKCEKEEINFEEHQNEEKEKKWTYEWKQLLLTTRLQNENEFLIRAKKRTVLWEKVLREIKSVDKNFPFSRDDIMRKFLNFMVTYKRIKKRKRSLGESSTSWEFFDAMDEVYGTRNDEMIPENTINSFECSLSDSHDSTSFLDAPPSPPEPSRKRDKCDIMEFLRSESAADKDLMNQFLMCEKEKLLVEKEKIEEIRKLREVLSNILKRKY